MGTKYIIEVEDKPFELLSEDGFTSEKLFRVKGFNSLVFDWNGLNMLTPYTEPDLEQVRREAYENGCRSGYVKYLNKSYEDGLNDAWEAARKIVLGSINFIVSVFGSGTRSNIIKDLTAAQAIEKLQAYEQEQEEKKKTNYYFEMVKDAIETTAEECGMNLDEVAAVLEKMRNESNAQIDTE